MSAQRLRRFRFLGLGLMTLIAVILLAEGARARSFATDRHRRTQEIEAREADLHRRLTNQAGVLESQRRIYMERFRALEARLRQKDGDIFALRARLAAQLRAGEAVTPPDVQ